MSEAQAKRGHWADLGETTFVGGTWFLYAVYRLLGRLPFRLCLYPVVFAWWLGSGHARRASLDYLRRLQAAEQVFPRTPGIRASLRHFLCFGETLLDKMLAIGGRYPRERIRFGGHEPMLAASRAGQGGVIATAHLGCLELLQMAAGRREGLRVTILVHTAHAQRFNSILGRLNPQATVRLLQVTDFSPAMAMALADRVAAGEFIAIAGDRVPVSGDRTCRANLLGAQAEFPAGPWLIASLLRCPVWALSCLHDGDGYRVRIEQLFAQVQLPRGGREAALDACAQRFADWLAGCLRQSPYDWFNFYDFWNSHADARRSH
ncbi:MAG: acyltransferase [Lysobacteraceae bacterium]|nr:MAG: acyltransferase [Xanthomonadaceae bacterium]